jgi:hypothetical protein
MIWIEKRNFFKNHEKDKIWKICKILQNTKSLSYLSSSSYGIFFYQRNTSVSYDCNLSSLSLFHTHTYAHLHKHTHTSTHTYRHTHTHIYIWSEPSFFQIFPTTSFLIHFLMIRMNGFFFSAYEVIKSDVQRMVKGTLQPQKYAQKNYPRTGISFFLIQWV